MDSVKKRMSTSSSSFSIRRDTMKCCFYILLALCLGYSSAMKTYEGYKVVQTEKLESQELILGLIKFVEMGKNSSEFYDFGVTPKKVGSTATIMVAPGGMERLSNFLEEMKIKFKVEMEDVGMMFKNESKKKASLRQGGKYAIDWNDYYGLEDIYTYLDQITVGKESYVSVETYGYSFEGRPLKLIKISRAGANSPNILVEGGIHAREWISPAMTTYMIHSLLLDPKNDHYLDKFNFHIIPSANPDGYEFSRNDTRFWRKTRSININSTCRGVDPNRNWGFHWHESGVSDDPCSEIFPGIEPFSEVEVASLRNYSLSLNPAPVMSLCIHSAAELFLVPYGYAVGALPENFKEMEEVGQKAVDALNGVHQSTFEVINAAAFWPGAGAADDWYKGVLKSRFVYTIELRKGAGNIFDLPVDQITPSGEELMPSIKVLLDNVYYLETHE